MMDELIKRLRELASIPEHCENIESCDECSKEDICLSFTNKRIIEVATQAADAIEELSKPRWIPVTEQKPKTDDIVIVAIHDDSGDTPYDVTNVGFYLDVFPLGIWVVENERCNYVTHWMPLPVLTKEE
jgi:hypothetical protein